MPSIQCPKCSAQLREDDFDVLNGATWMHGYLTIRLECWACTWKMLWAAPDSRSFEAQSAEKEEVKA